MCSKKKQKNSKALNSFSIYINIVRSLIKSQWSEFSTSTKPHGYILPRTFFPLTSNVCPDEIIANGKDFFNWKFFSFNSSSSSESQSGIW